MVVTPVSVVAALTLLGAARSPTDKHNVNKKYFKYILLHAFPCNTGEYCTSAGMYFHESEGRVKILPA